MAGSPLEDVVEEVALARRSAAAKTDDLPVSTRSTRASSSSCATTTRASTTTIPSSTPSSSVDIDTPYPFDAISLATNVTTSCSNFISSIVNNQSFRDCIPLSGLLRDSVGFFDIMKDGAFTTTTILDRSCNVDVDKCGALMDSYSGPLRSSNVCQSDYQLQNPIVTDMYTALVAYRTLYAAGCLKASSGDYCFVDAVTNATSPQDLFIYSLALGTTLPTGSNLTCSQCLANTMRTFSIAAGNKTQPVSSVYVSAAEQINSECGTNFVDATVTIYDNLSPPKPGSGYTAAAMVLLALLGFLHLL